MKLIQSIPADNWTQAFRLGNGDMGIQVYGRTGQEQIGLLEKNFLKQRDQRAGKGKAVVGHLQIETGQEEIENYSRSLDLARGTAHASWEWKGERTSVMAFVPKAYQVAVYEITRPINDMNVKISYLPQCASDYVCYQMGGLFFTSSLEHHILCGKAALYTNGFPKADEQGLSIKKASRVALYIMLDETGFGEKEEETRAMLDLQMGMNRHLVQMESHSLEELRKGPMGNLSVYRKMQNRLSKALPDKWKNGSLE